MWCQEFSPDNFLEQTALTFAASLRGRAKARDIADDRDLRIAWHTAAFTSAASIGKLKDLSEYLNKDDKKEGQTPQQMLGALRLLNDMGAPMTIKQIN